MTDAYHNATRERDALAQQLAHEWGWPDRESVLTRLRGDRTAALATFTDDAYLAYLGAALDRHTKADEPNRVLTDAAVFWDSRMGGVFLLDGSQQFYPAAQVKRCWHTTDTKAEPPKADPRLVSYVNKKRGDRHTKADA